MRYEVMKYERIRNLRIDNGYTQKQVAEYLNIDVTVVRVLWAITSVFAAAGIVAYIICAFLIPEKPDGNIVDAE